MATTLPAVVLDRTELAWAAGFFDGEGSTMVHTDESRPGYLRLEVVVPQVGHDGLPAVLLRFQRAVGGLGRIGGPERDDLYECRSSMRLEAFAIVALLWNDLGAVKRRQANGAIKAFLNQYESRTVEARGGRHVSRVFDLVKASPSGPSDSHQLELAWAAGFLDAEGCFGLAKGNKRVAGRSGIGYVLQQPSMANRPSSPRFFTACGARFEASEGSSATVTMTTSSGSSRETPTCRWSSMPCPHS
jgi:hypothetical protein